MKAYLSKSQFLRGLQCHKSLWFRKYKPDLIAPPDESQQVIFDTGTEVGKLARRLFPDGEEIIYEERSLNEKIKQTKKLINNGVKTIYEATFSHNNVLVMVDILHKGRRGLEIYEVKSSTEVKDVNISDLSVQYYVLSGCGFTISKASLVYINTEYVRKSKLDIKKLFCITNFTKEVKENQKSVNSQLRKMRIMLKEKCPDIDIGERCSDPYHCDFTEHCWKHIPEYSIFNISRLKWAKRFDLYRKGILKFKDIPKDYHLSKNQRLQVETELTNKTVINKKGIKEFLKTVYYPLYFLDFETFMPAIPLYNGIRPYQKIPFQFSLHCLENKKAKLKHYEFLAKEGIDQREEIGKRLTKLIPGKACVIAYNMSFEKGVLTNLAEEFPKYSKKLFKRRDNIIDLMIPFQKKYYYTNKMKGSHSIKKVLPTLLPDLTYEGMAISGGGEAMNTYATLHLLKDKKEVKKIRKDLLEYCKLDTFAMVKLLERLRDVIKKEILS